LEIVALPDVPRIAGAPFTVSLATTLLMGREAMPASAVPVSGNGSADPASAGVAHSIALQTNAAAISAFT
jgi:hypothetical protein